MQQMRLPNSGCAVKVDRLTLDGPGGSSFDNPHRRGMRGPIARRNNECLECALRVQRRAFYKPPKPRSPALSFADKPLRKFVLLIEANIG